MGNYKPLFQDKAGVTRKLKCAYLFLMVSTLVCALVGFFAAQQGEGMPMTFTVGMLILGFFLLLAEFFIIPGFGIAGVSGFLLIIFSVYAATVGLEGGSTTDRLVPDSDNDWIRVQAWATTFLGTAVLGTVGALTLAKTMHRVPFLSRAFVKPPILDAARATGVAAAGRVRRVRRVRRTRRARKNLPLLLYFEQTGLSSR